MGQMKTKTGIFLNNATRLGYYDLEVVAVGRFTTLPILVETAGTISLLQLRGESTPYRVMKPGSMDLMDGAHGVVVTGHEPRHPS